MFAPLNYVWEDPATGNASAAWGHSSPRSTRAVMLIWKIAVEQGLQMGHPSAIEVQVRKRAGCVLEVAIAGFCVPVMQGTIKLLQVCI